MLKKIPGYVIAEGRKTIRKLRELTGEPALVLELGCNDGQHSRLFLEEYQGLQLHCFEPDPRPRERFPMKVDDKRCTLWPFAIAAADGEVSFHPSGGQNRNSWLPDWDLSGSIRKPTGHLQFSSWVTFKDPIKVPARSLDSWTREQELQRIDLIWADLQGAEVDMIEGGTRTMKMTRYLFTECYEKPLYEGQINLQGILNRLKNFELVWREKDDVLLRNKDLT